MTGSDPAFGLILTQSEIGMKSKTYRPPLTISREDFLAGGSDAGFRSSIYTMVQCVGRLLVCRDAFGRELELTPSQFAVVMGVAHTQGDDGVTIRHLAEYVALAPTHVTTEVGRLESAGFLTKRQSDTDRRSVRVSLLPHAETEIARVAPFVRRVNDLLFRGIDVRSLGIAGQVARKLILNSEMALAEIRRHQLESAVPVPALVGERPGAVSRAVNGRATPRPAGRSRMDGKGRKGRGRTPVNMTRRMRPGS
jgi:DNA-binding MarR family transcriptional regulator